MQKAKISTAFQIAKYPTKLRWTISITFLFWEGLRNLSSANKFHFKDRVILLDFAHSFINCLYKRINEMVHLIKWYIMPWVSACEKCAIFKK